MSVKKAVDSSANPRFKALRRLVESSRERKHAGRSVLDGAHLVTAYCEHIGRPESLVVSRQGLEKPEIRSLLEKMTGVDTLVLGDALFKALSSLVTPTGILAVVETPRQQNVPGNMGACVMLEDLQDPGNLGSILRSCAAAGIRHVLLSRGSVHAWSPRVLRAGMGAHFALAIYEDADLVSAASSFAGDKVAAVPRAQRTIFDTNVTGNVAFLLGNEGAGLSTGLLATADSMVSIPMPGKAESINVAAAAAVCLFERVRQLSALRRPGPTGGR